jgi:uncharacterized protein YdeI (YjbR/CyaY-like superfamily)
MVPPAKPTKPPKPTYFATPAAFRAWLESHHATSTELLVGFYKRGSGKPSITWPESVDEALCFGWIDGVRRSVNDERYTIRFTPRKARSTWSAVNIKRVAELTKLGRMQPAGIEAFSRREEKTSQIYAYEQRADAAFDDEFEGTFRANRRAWEFFQAQAPWYCRNATYWVMTAKKEETRRKRLAALIADSARGKRIDRLTPNKSRTRGTSP